MCLANPSTTASVTLTSGCSDVPDFSAYLRAYAHILSMFAWDGCAMSFSPWPSERLRRAPALDGRAALAGGQCFVDLRRVEAAQASLADEDHGQRRQSQLHQFLARAGVAADVALGERYALLRQILCRAVAGPSADVRVAGHLRRHRSSSLVTRVAARIVLDGPRLGCPSCRSASRRGR